MGLHCGWLHFKLRFGNQRRTSFKYVATPYVPQIIRYVGHRISTVEQREGTFIARLYGCRVCQPTVTEINAQPLLASDSVRYYPYICHYIFYCLSGGQGCA